MAKLLDKFRGSLVGALAGDCLGSFFEGVSSIPIPIEHVKDIISKKIEQVEPGSITYSDDTAMTRAICKSLIEKQGFDDEHMAYEFSKEFFKEPNRGYGERVREVFVKLKDKVEDFRQPAREQFDGTGSYGNGAAMRISPIALYSKDSASLIEYARRSAEITHVHINGVNGAIIQAQAVFNALVIEPPNLDKNQYIDDLAEVAEILKTKISFPYELQLKEMKTLLSLPMEEITSQKVKETFGNGIRAEQAVPAAIFAFLFKGTDSVKECIHFAISLGGDTDTIASMAGAISGAYLGLQAIPESWKEKCEASKEAIDFADKVFELREKEAVKSK
ncbi:ADP-ribose glycohydrolase ARH3-like [Actinia tenebrosa]|uniref:ADP-ribosylhydrolase ARH3 n=1 Tax=Actinia tenebrosa TaxID=6105 RepID=A0A6P8HFC8_ACTTE|nr:ADP-ribose glycohydrolase ARH3-like [Actinia tenebrosa]